MLVQVHKSAGPSCCYYNPPKQMKVIRNFRDGTHMELGVYVREHLDKRTENYGKLTQKFDTS